MYKKNLYMFVWCFACLSCCGLCVGQNPNTLINSTLKIYKLKKNSFIFVRTNTETYAERTRH